MKPASHPLWKSIRDSHYLNGSAACTNLAGRRFHHGDFDDETTVYSQRHTFQLISDHRIQKGLSFPHPTDVLINDSDVNNQHDNRGNRRMPMYLVNRWIPSFADSKGTFRCATETSGCLTAGGSSYGAMLTTQAC